MGGQFVLSAGEQRFSRHGASDIVTFSLPSFYDNFKDGKITGEDLLIALKEQVNTFEKLVNEQ